MYVGSDRYDIIIINGVCSKYKSQEKDQKSERKTNRGKNGNKRKMSNENYARRKMTERQRD